MITGIILGAGLSRRMGKDKLLLEVDGEKIIEKVVKACVASNLDHIILIYRNKEVMEIGRKYNIKTILNEKPELGQSESLKLGVRQAECSNAYMFLVGDQPFLNSDLINRLIKEYKENKEPILVPYYSKQRGMPMIISNVFKETLLGITGDKGARDIIRDNTSKVKRVYIEDGILGVDIDTPEDYKRYK